LAADDYITKPFDIEELRLRVQNAQRRAERESLTNPTTGLPGGKLIEEQLRLAHAEKELGGIVHGPVRIEAFNDVYGFVAAMSAALCRACYGETVDQLGTAEDFIGMSRDDFIIITTGACLCESEALAKRFNARWARITISRLGNWAILFTKTAMARNSARH